MIFKQECGKAEIKSLLHCYQFAYSWGEVQMMYCTHTKHHEDSCLIPVFADFSSAFNTLQPHIFIQ